MKRLIMIKNYYFLLFLSLSSLQAADRKTPEERHPNVTNTTSAYLNPCWLLGSLVQDGMNQLVCTDTGRRKFTQGFSGMSNEDAIYFLSRKNKDGKTITNIAQEHEHTCLLDAFEKEFKKQTGMDFSTQNLEKAKRDLPV